MVSLDNVTSIGDWRNMNFICLWGVGGGGGGLVTHA